MAQSPSHTAILVFTRNATTEARYKRFQKHISFQQNKAIANALIEKTMATVKATHLPYFIVDDKQQQGLTFGERISQAAATIFNKGFEHLIIIGNDTPCLCANRIITTAELLTKQEVVIGPSTDGGVYLIGLQRSAFQQDTFRDLPWLTTQLATTLTEYAASVCQLPFKTDIDTSADFTNYLKSTPFSCFTDIRLILGLVKKPTLIDYKKPILRFLQPTFGLRAPPSLL